MSSISPEDIAALLTGTSDVDVIAKRYGVAPAEVERQLNHSRSVLGSLVAPRARRSRVVLGLIAGALVVTAAAAVAQTTCNQVDGLCVFSANQPAIAEQVNRNFSVLNDRVRQTAARAGVTSYTSDGGVPAPGALTAASVTVTGASTLTGNVNVGGTLTSATGLEPNWDSGWVNVAAAGTIVTLPHTLNASPRQMQIWWRASPAATFQVPVAHYDEGMSVVSGPSVAVSATQLKYQVVYRPIGYFRFSGDGSTLSGSEPAPGSQYRFLLWR